MLTPCTVELSENTFEVGDREREREKEREEARENLWRE